MNMRGMRYRRPLLASGVIASRHGSGDGTAIL